MATSLDYTVTNTGEYRLFRGHGRRIPLFVAEAGDRIVFPDSIHELRLEGSGGGTAGKGRRSRSHGPSSS